MSIVVTATLDVSQLQGNIETLINNLNDIGGPLLEGVNEIMIPLVKSNSATDWTVRTGRYSNSWYAGILGPHEVQITNTANYSMPLETGWRTRKGGSKSGKHTLLRTMEASMEGVMGFLMDWLLEQLSP